MGLPFNKRFGGGLSSLIIGTIAFWSTRDVADGQVPNKIGAQDRISAGGQNWTGRAFNFDGSNYVRDTVTTSFEIADATDHFAWSCWVKTGSDITSIQAIGGKMKVAGNPGRYGFYISSGVVRALFETDSNTGNIQDIITLETDTWYHLAASIDLTDDNRIEFFIDGVSQNPGGTTVPGAFPASSLPFTLGRRPVSTNVLLGDMRDFRVFHGDIRTSVDAIKAGERQGSEIGWYWCEDDNTSFAFDASGNDIDLPMTSFTTANLIEHNEQSLANKHGYAIDGTYGLIPPDMSTGSPPTHDINGDPLTFKGQAKYGAISRDGGCFNADGVTYFSQNPDYSDTVDFECRVKINDRTVRVNYLCSLYDNSSNNFYISVGTDGTLRFQGEEDNTLAVTTSVESLDEGTWYTVRYLSVPGQPIQMWIDGVEVTYGGQNTALNMGHNDFIRFLSFGTTSPLVDANVDWIRYNGRLYTFTEGRGSTVYDTSGEGRHATSANIDDHNWGTVDYPVTDYLAEKGVSLAASYNLVDRVHERVITEGSYLEDATEGKISGRMYVEEGQNAMLFCSADKSSGSRYVLFYYYASGNYFRMDFRGKNGAATWNAVRTSTTFTTGWYDVEFGTTGSEYYIKVDGVDQALTVTTGFNDGDWFDTVLLRDSVGIGSLIDSTPTYGAGAVMEVKMDDGVNGHWKYDPATDSFIDSSSLGLDLAGSGDPEEKLLLPALEDQSADVTGGEIQYPQGGANLIPETYISMPEVYELLQADRQDRLEGGLMADGRGTFTPVYGPLENVSDCVNSTYTSFSGASPTGFRAVSDGASVHRGGTADEITYNTSRSVRISMFVTLHSGTLPTVDLANAFAGSSRTEEGPQQLVEGENVIVFTPTTSSSGVLEFKSTNQAVDFTVSDLACEPVLDHTDKELWNKYGTNIVSNDDGALKIEYVDNANGAFAYINTSYQTVEDLTIDDTYELIARVRVNAGATVVAQVYDGTGLFVEETLIATEWTEIKLRWVAKHARNCYFRIKSMGAGEIAWIDNYEILKVVESLGNNLVTNCGTRNVSGALTTGDWVDSIVSGVADGWSISGDGVGSIVTGNGFSSRAQRVEAQGTSTLRLNPPKIDLRLGILVRVRFKYRTNRSDILITNGVASAAIPANTGDAAYYEADLVPAADYDNIGLRINNLVTATAGDYLEIDEFSFRYVLDGEFFEPEDLGSDPVVVGMSYLINNPWRYLTRYVNPVDRKDLMLLGPSTLNYQDHQELLEYTKNT